MCKQLNLEIMLWSLFKKETKSDVIQEDRNHI